MIVARLVRSYGGSPMQWLAETPLAVIEAMLGALPRLEAGETLMAVQAHALGAGTMKAEDSKRILRDLEQQAGVRRAARKFSPEHLAAMGIRVSPA